MENREQVIALVKALGITPEELGIEPKVITDKQLIHEISEMIRQDEIEKEHAREFFDEKYWDDLGIAQKEYRVVKVSLRKTIYKHVDVVIPQDEPLCGARDYVMNLGDLDNDYPEDEDDWEEYDEEEMVDRLTKKEIENRFDSDDIWNYDDVMEMED